MDFSLRRKAGFLDAWSREWMNTHLAKRVSSKSPAYRIHFLPQHHLSLDCLSEPADLHVCALRRCSRFFHYKTDSAYAHHTLLHGYTTLIIEL